MGTGGRTGRSTLQVGEQPRGAAPPYPQCTASWGRSLGTHPCWRRGANLKNAAVCSTPAALHGGPAPWANQPASLERSRSASSTLSGLGRGTSALILSTPAGKAWPERPTKDGLNGRPSMVRMPGGPNGSLSRSKVAARNVAEWWVVPEVRFVQQGDAAVAVRPVRAAVDHGHRVAAVRVAKSARIAPISAPESSWRTCRPVTRRVPSARGHSCRQRAGNVSASNTSSCRPPK